MAVAWPVTLQDKVNEDSFAHQIGETVLRSSNETGPVKVRRRFTRPINTFNVSIDLTVAEYSTFYYFYNTTLNGGVTPFDFVNPITGVLNEYRFTGAPAFSSLGGGHFRVTMGWEQLN